MYTLQIAKHDKKKQKQNKQKKKKERKERKGVQDIHNWQLDTLWFHTKVETHIIFQASSVSPDLSLCDALMPSTQEMSLSSSKIKRVHDPDPKSFLSLGLTIYVVWT